MYVSCQTMFFHHWPLNISGSRTVLLSAATGILLELESNSHCSCKLHMCQAERQKLNNFSNTIIQQLALTKRFDWTRSIPRVLTYSITALGLITYNVISIKGPTVWSLVLEFSMFVSVSDQRVQSAGLSDHWITMWDVELCSDFWTELVWLTSLIWCLKINEI